jgi:glucan phosphoethanolaminetransferase (alkaline phosphatase superfamily)
MALRLFRSTGYSTLLMPGESRLAPHPGKLIFWASIWLGVVCNVAVWRLLAGDPAGLRTAVSSSLVIAGTTGLGFSILGWRRTLKPAVTLGLIAGALVASALWTQQLPIETLWHGPSRTWLPAWASLLRWQVLVLVMVLAVVPIVTLWNVSLRRLPGPVQMRVNLTGCVLAALVLGAGLALLA